MLKCQENNLKYIIDSTKCEFLDLQEISQPSFLIDILPRKLKVQTRMVQFIQLLEHNWFVNRQVNAVR